MRVIREVFTETAMKDHSVELRRLGRGYARRVTAANRAVLRERPTVTRAEKQRDKRNWRVETSSGEVVAVEPERTHEHVFQGGDDPFWQAVEFAAKQLREAMA